MESSILVDFSTVSAAMEIGAGFALHDVAGQTLLETATSLLRKRLYQTRTHLVCDSDIHPNSRPKQYSQLPFLELP